MSNKISESQLQKQCVKWFKLQHRTRLLFAIPNGGKRDKITASIMQGEGVVAGVRDFMNELTENEKELDL